MKWLLVFLLLALVALGGWQARKLAAVAEQQEQAKLEAVQKAREAVSADLQGLREAGARHRAEIARQAAVVARLQAQATAARKEVATVREAGDRLRSAPADEVIAECVRQGYTCRMER